MFLFVYFNIFVLGFKLLLGGSVISFEFIVLVILFLFLTPILHTLMHLFLMVFSFFYDSMASIFSNMGSYSFYKSSYESISVFVCQVVLSFKSANSFFLESNKMFYTYTEDKGLFLCLFYVFMSFMFIMIFLLVFYCSCPLYLGYFSKVIFLFLKGMTSVSFKFKFFEVNTYLMTLFSYLMFFFMSLFFMFLFLMYFYLFVLVFYYNVSSVFLMVKSYFSF